MKIATWNINSVRLRKEQILSFLKKEKIDLICLQETKVTNEEFPLKYFNKEGFIYSYIRGEKSYNGVAILSKIPIKKKIFYNFCGLNDARHIQVVLDNSIIIHNFYVPAGGDIPDINKNPKFKHKVKFLKEMIDFLKVTKKKSKILLGDFNIAPMQNDVWSHKQLLNVVSHTKLEVDYFNELLDKAGVIDITREFFNLEERIYTWWSYRNRNWAKSDRGRRLDHILISESLKGFIQEVKLYKSLRGEKNPSDHIPVSIALNV